MAYIHYDQKSNVAVYVSVYEFYRDGKKVKIRRLENLGRVIDKENGIFSQRGHVFQYTVENGRGEAPGSYAHEKIVPDVERIPFQTALLFQHYQHAPRRKRHASLARFLPAAYQQESQLPCESLVRGLLCIPHVPRANLTSQNISRVLKELGSEEVQRSFFEEYLSDIYGDSGMPGILVDSTGVPNATKMDVT